MWNKPFTRKNGAVNLLVTEMLWSKKLSPIEVSIKLNFLVQNLAKSVCNLHPNGVFDLDTQHQPQGCLSKAFWPILNPIPVLLCHLFEPCSAAVEAGKEASRFWWGPHPTSLGQILALWNVLIQAFCSRGQEEGYQNLLLSDDVHLGVNLSNVDLNLWNECFFF